VKIDTSHQRTAEAKALEVNMDIKIYGAFAEIGAGQEVARHFFQAGKASQTIAKTISAYDMIYSDEIYGREANGRYVCESRLLKMLEKEYSLLQKRLSATRGDQTSFFAFADTVATGDTQKRHPHGWIGVRFQVEPGQPFNDIVLHIRLLDRYRLLQQEALGVTGVNLVHAAFKRRKSIPDFINALVENLKDGQIIIDMIRFKGPDVSHFNNHLVNLELVRRGLTEAVLFSPDQEILSITESLYGKSVVIERGRFRPVTSSHLQLLEKGQSTFKKIFETQKKPITLFEVTMHQLQSGGKFDESDFLDRVRALASTGTHVLVSNFLGFYKLKQFLRLHTKEPLAMIIGAGSLEPIFADKYYEDLEGGLIEGVSKLLDKNSRLFVYPLKKKDQCTTAETFFPHKDVLHFYKHCLENQWIVDMADCDEVEDFVTAEDLAKMIKSGDKSWTRHVPASVAEMIKKENLFGLLKKA
jgi:hypothetical protein